MTRAAILVALAACYPGVDNSDCQILCGEDDACPSNLSCDGRFCVTEGQVCGDPTLVLAYSFDEIVNDTVLDESGAGNTALLLHGPDLVTAVHDKGLAFDGNDDRSITPHAPSLAVGAGGAFTVELWIFIAGSPSTTVDQIVIGKVWEEDAPVSPFYEFGIEFDSSTQSLELFVGDEDNQAHRTYFIEAPIGTFAHVAYTWDGNIVAGYLDGVPVEFANPALSIRVPDRGRKLVIGSQTTEVEYFRGTVDDVRIYNRALSRSEIGRDMNTPVGAP